MIQEGRSGEDDPLLCIFDKAFRLMRSVFFRVLHVDGSVAVGDPRRGPHEDRGAVLFRQREGLFHHVVGFLRRGRVKTGNLGKPRKTAGILLRLGADGARIVRYEHHHAALYPDVLHAHQGVGCHVQSHLLHGHENAAARIGCSCRHFHGSLFIDGPFDVAIRRTVLGDRLQDLRRRRAGIAADQVDPGSDRAHGDGFVSH